MPAIITAQMHENFLREIRRDIAAREAELDELRIVERYHQSQLDGELPPKVGATEERALSAPLAPGARKMDAIKMALRELGGSAKTLAIVNWMRTNGLATGTKSNVFYNGVFTTLKRGVEGGDFRRDDTSGKWVLLPEAHDGPESVNT